MSASEGGSFIGGPNRAAAARRRGGGLREWRAEERGLEAAARRVRLLSATAAHLTALRVRARRALYSGTPFTAAREPLR